MEENSSNKGLIIMLIVFIIIALSLAGYIIYDKVIDKKDVETKEEKKIEEKKEEKKPEEKKEELKSTFSLQEEYGIVYVEGYATKEIIEASSMYEDLDGLDKAEYVFFNITNTDSNDFMTWIEGIKGNTFVKDKAIGLGCIHEDYIRYYNSSDEADCEEWVEKLTEQELFVPQEDYTPQAGDLIFFDFDDNPKYEEGKSVECSKGANGNQDFLFLIHGVRCLQLFLYL